MGISNTRMYEQVVRAMARQSIALEILAYHTSASVEEVQRLKVSSHSFARLSRVQAPHRAYKPFGISIGSAVFARRTTVANTQTDRQTDRDHAASRHM